MVIYILVAFAKQTLEGQKELVISRLCCCGQQSQKESKSPDTCFNSTVVDWAVHDFYLDECT